MAAWENFADAIMKYPNAVGGCHDRSEDHFRNNESGLLFYYPTQADNYPISQIVNRQFHFVARMYVGYPIRFLGQYSPNKFLIDFFRFKPNSGLLFYYPTQEDYEQGNLVPLTAIDDGLYDAIVPKIVL